MDIGNTLLLTALFSAVASVLLCKRNNYYFLWMLRWTFFSLSLAVLLLVYYFISKDFSINYVYMYGGNQPLVYNIAAFWTGKEGIHLLLAWATMLCILFFQTKNKENHGFALKTLRIVLIIEILLLIITLADSPFKPIMGVFNTDALSGNGLSPKFISPWFLVHPPLLVMAYAASIILFAAAMVYLHSGEKEWVRTARSWGRFSWLMLSLGMATGGLWAYEIIEWNGFWRWDPVQSGALAVWLVLTAALHAIVRHGHNSLEYKTTAPLLAASVFILNIYVMFFTRIEVRGSKHNFIGSAVWPVLLVGVFLAIIAVLFLILKRKRSDSGGAIQNLKPASLNSMRSSFHATILLLCMLAFVPVWSILHSLTSEEIGEFIPIPEEVYNLWSFPIILMLTLLTVYCMLQGVVKRKDLISVMLASIFIGIVTAFLPETQTPTLLSYTSEFYQQSTLLVQSIGSAPMFSYVSVSLFAIIGTMFRFLYGKNRFSYNNIGIGLIHAGFILIVLGAVASTSFSKEGSLDYALKELNILQNIDLTWSAEITDYSIMDIGDGWERTLNLSIYKNGESHGSGTLSLAKSDGSGYFHKVLLHRTLFTDILIHFASDTPGQSVIKLNVKVVPLVNLLWGGVLLMICGIIFLVKPNLSSKTG
ncbi:cytochrome c biogenesis factor [Candidatus Methanoperedens nitroreducens]|uniref:Cytochrome c biogenesis factor n=1 Tax=Candidatus Methanoperedens nitratireducens TaxID=1392998 RepID=A0A062VCQ6_9EURY|nr:cytochrome c biogenesis protein CcsA [Candidatus Methanoperedens nitroreducens]KCZ73035.1 cytochrome c biogenesis factor [Candidatus Methanoperedens nitroreducens]MDJ1423020.1 cytochrome c biogenesis protein CcsA [Candidatus Methanoperedens sp.]